MERPASRARRQKASFLWGKGDPRRLCKTSRGRSSAPAAAQAALPSAASPFYQARQGQSARGAEQCSHPPPSFPAVAGGPRGPVPRTYAYRLKNGEAAASVARPRSFWEGRGRRAPPAAAFYGVAQRTRAPAEKRAGRHGATDRQEGRHGRAPSAPASTSQGREDSPL